MHAVETEWERSRVIGSKCGACGVIICAHGGLVPRNGPKACRGTSGCVHTGNHVGMRAEAGAAYQRLEAGVHIGTAPADRPTQRLVVDGTNGRVGRAALEAIGSVGVGLVVSMISVESLCWCEMEQVVEHVAECTSSRPTDLGASVQTDE